MNILPEPIWILLPLLGFPLGFPRHPNSRNKHEIKDFTKLQIDIIVRPANHDLIRLDFYPELVVT
jgi:hypothetical protein